MIKELMIPFKLSRLEDSIHSYICIGKAHMSDLEHLKHSLSKREHIEFNKLLSSKRSLEYVLGRYIGKKSVLPLIGNQDIRNITINKGVFQQPILYSENNRDNLQISLSHANNTAIAIAFPERHPMGIDIEVISLEIEKYLSKYLLDDERFCLRKIGIENHIGLMLLWTAKESISKVLHTGLTVPLSIYAINKIEKCCESYISEFSHFPQYKVITFINGNYMCSICLPKNSSIEIDYNKFNKILS